MVSCPQYGALTRHISDHILTSRRRHLSEKYNLSPPLEPPVLDIMAGAPGQLSPEDRERRRIQGGAIIIGRHTLKEYMQGLKDGYMNGIVREDREKVVERVLEGDGVFETKEEIEAKKVEAEERARNMMSNTGEAAPVVNNPVNLSAMSFMNRPMVPTPTPTPTSVPSTPPVDPLTLLPSHAHLPPAPLPEQPTMLLVPWINHLGFKQVPYMIWDLFTERYKYKIGGEAGLKLIFGEKREFIGGRVSEVGSGVESGMGQEKMLQDMATESKSSTFTSNSSPSGPSDLDFDLDAEGYYKKAFNETHSRIQKNRESYYSELKTRLATARELASGTREPTADEQARPPTTESELRQERLKREVRWMNEEQGYEVVKKGQPVTWDGRWESWLNVYGDVPAERYPALPVEEKQQEEVV
jgi:import inner membrane translocase subunit TIM54